MSKRLYAAYGSNLNLRQMKYRCPTAKLYGIGVLEDYELQFKGHSDSAYATIAPKKGASVPVAVWEIQPSDECSLDRYEGCPSHYFKENVPVQLDGKNIDAMAYIMNLKMDFGLPSVYYYKTVYDGYRDCGLDTGVLGKAVKDSAQKYYSSAVRYSVGQGVFCNEDDENEVNENEEDDDEEMIDESDPFYFSDGMHL